MYWLINLHVYNLSDTPAARSTSLVELINLTQHKRYAVHIRGNILDLVLTRPSANLIVDCIVDSLTPDHFLVAIVLKSGCFQI